MIFFFFWCFICVVWVSRGWGSPPLGPRSRSLVQGLKEVRWGQDLGWLGTPRPRRMGSWWGLPAPGLERPLPFFGVASDRNGFSQLCLWAGLPSPSLPFLVGIHLWEICGEGRDDHTYFIHWETEAKPPMAGGSSLGKWGRQELGKSGVWERAVPTSPPAALEPEMLSLQQ